MRRWVVPFVLIPLALASSAPAFASRSPRGILGAWDVTVRDSTSSRPAWFDVHPDSNGGSSLAVTFQGSYGAAEHAQDVTFDHDILEFVTPTFGRFRGRFNGSWFVHAPADPSRKPIWTAVRAPALPDRRVSWGEPVMLFDGRSLEGWHARWNRERGWIVRDGAMAVTMASNDLVSDRTFKDFKLHLQYRLRPNGDSGVHLRGRYEIQATDRAEAVGHIGLSGAVYGQVPPVVSAEKPAGEWNTLDVTLVGRWLTATLNGRTIHDHVPIPGITGDALDSREGSAGPIMLQGHIGGVEFRDIVVTPTR
jgi:hypothetical protein